MKYPKNNAGLRAQLNIMQYMLHVIKEISVQVILLQQITGYFASNLTADT